jgi:hypothetical protein
VVRTRTLHYNSILANLTDIEERLRADLERARESYAAANAEFWKISADIPSGLPSPDSTQRIQIAARRQNLARKQLVEALHRMNEFLQTGAFPDVVAR